MNMNNIENKVGHIVGEFEQPQNVLETMAQRHGAVAADAEAVVPDDPMSSTLESRALDDGQFHDIKSLLERRVVLGVTNWSDSDPAIPITYNRADYAEKTEHFLVEYEMPSAAFERSALMREKLNNFQFFRANMEFEVKINSNPFQQGMAVCTYEPKANQIDDFRRYGTSFMPSITSLPRRNIDLSNGNTTMMTVPYVNDLDFYDLSKDIDFGSFRVYVISPLRSGNAAIKAADITVTSRFTDVEVMTPTASSILSVQRYADLHINNIRKMMRMQEGEETQATGPLAKISHAVDNVVKPVLNVAKTVLPWVPRIFGGLAQVVGLSKPTDAIIPTNVRQRQGAFMANTEGKDFSNTLAQLPDNAIDSTTFVPSTIDEMAISYPTQRPAIFNTYLITPTEFSDGKKLFSFPVTPIQPTMIANGNELNMSTFAYVCMMYRLWRGNLKYNVRLIKTNYHSGRLLLVYFPRQLNAPDTFDESMTTNYNLLVDLNPKSGSDLTSEHIMDIPYVSNQPFLSTFTVNANNPVTNNDECATGVIAAYALNKLVYPETVEGTITAVVEHCAGDNFKLAIPNLALQAGFSAVETDVVGAFIAAFNGTFPASLWTGDRVENEASPVLEYSAGPGLQFGVSWVGLNGAPMVTPDGVYSIQVDLTSVTDQAGPALKDGPVTFGVGVSSGVIVTCSSNFIVAAATGSENFQMTVSQLAKMQEGDGASVPMPPDSLLIGSTHSNIEEGTVGEYTVSLRALSRRFGRFGTLAERNYSQDFSNGTLLFGLQTTNGEESGRRGIDDNIQPETPMSLMSYIYRFVAGGIRYKAFGSFDSSFIYGLHPGRDEFLYNSITQNPTPVIHQSGVVDPVLEVTKPFYCKRRALINGIRDASQTQEMCLIQNPPVAFYEAAADDTNFWYVVGPPVMTFTVNQPNPTI